MEQLKEPKIWDAVNNVFTGIINALNHLISCLNKLGHWDSSYTLFERRDYTSPELRTALTHASSINKDIVEIDMLDEDPSKGSATP